MYNLVRILIFVICSFAVWDTADGQVQAYGQIFFVPGKGGPTHVNPRIVQFYRRFDLSIIQSNIQLMRQFNEIYKHYCANVTSKAQTPDRFVKLFKHVYFTDARTQCATEGLQPWTINNIVDEIKAKQLMVEQSVTDAQANVYLADDEETIRSSRDDINQTYLLRRSCASCKPGPKFSKRTFKEHHKDAQLVWKYELTSRGIILIADPHKVTDMFTNVFVQKHLTTWKIAFFA